MADPLVCATVAAPTMAELRRRRDAIDDADLIELRLDAVSDPMVAGALEGRSTPVIVTCRPKWEGGAFGGSEEERHRLLGDALALGAEYVDIEWRAHFDDLIQRTRGRRIVLSAHDFRAAPVDLAGQVHGMRATGAEVIKIAATMTSLSDCLPLRDFGAGEAARGDLILIGMGEYGMATRILARRFGSRWTYAGPLEHVGQLSVRALLDQYRFRSIDDATELYGLVGAPIGHSVSPDMHNAAFAAARRNAVYLSLPAAGADDFVRFAKAMGLNGASVTVPFKVALFDRVDEIYAVARRIGAINTIRVEQDGRWIGANTDASGFAATLQDRLTLDRVRASVLGAGGAARAVAAALSTSGCDVTIHARHRAQAEDLAVFTSAAVGPWPPKPGSWDLLVNCTPIGMHPHERESPVAADQLTGRWVYDLVYNPPMTRLLREAQAAGCEVIGGLEMLVAQAHEQFQWWMGSRPPAGVMREAALKRLAEFARDEHYLV